MKLLLDFVMRFARVTLALIPALLAMFLMVFFVSPLVVVSRWLNVETPSEVPDREA